MSEGNEIVTLFRVSLLGLVMSEPQCVVGALGSASHPGLREVHRRGHPIDIAVLDRNPAHFEGKG